MITNSNSLCRERDAQSNGRRFSARHVWYRAVPRTNRTLTTANSHNHSARSNTTGSPVCAPWLPWQCFCADAVHSRRAFEITDILEAVVSGKVRGIAIAREVSDSVLYHSLSELAIHNRVWGRGPIGRF